MNIQKALRDRCSDWIAHVGGICGTLGFAEYEPALRADLDRAVADPRVRIVVCGEWSTGKSTLVNAIVGKAGLLPTDVAPCTSYVTVVETAAPEERYEVVRDVGTKAISREEFLSMTAARDNDATVDLVRVTSQISWPPDDVVLVDTPGLEDITRTRSDITLKILPNADVIVLVMSAVTGVMGTVATFVRDHLTASELRRVVLVLNKKDHLNASEDIDKRLRACKAILKADLPGASWVATDARAAEKSGPGSVSEESGIPSLRDAILRVARRERAEILGLRFVRLARARLNDIHARVMTEDAALGLTLAETEQRLGEFRKKVAEAFRENEVLLRKAGALITEDLEPWFAMIPARVGEVRTRALHRIQSLDDLDALRAYVNTDELGCDLALQLRHVTDELSTRLSDAIQKAGREVLSEKIVLPGPVELPGSGTLPPVESIFRHVPKFVVQLLEVLLADLAMPGGLLAAIAARLGLGKLLQSLRSLGFLRILMPADLVRMQLESAVAESLTEFAERVIPDLRASADDAIERAMNEFRSALDRRADAIEAGFELAKAQLSTDRTRIAARRAVLSSGRSALETLRAELDDVTRELR
jgi:signal recognition particle receptor subunit beta/uncharacterized protein (DUF2267 family)